METKHHDIPSAVGVASRYAVGRGDVEANKQDVLALAGRNLASPPEGWESRYGKYYESNPLGAPYFLLAHDSRSQRVVGMASLFPTRLRVGGAPVGAAITGDFAVDAEHRGFGPALPLQRATLSAVSEDGFACAYGSPNPFSEPVIDRVGYSDVGRLKRFVKVLQARVLVDAYVHRRRLARLAGSALSATVDPLLELVSPERRKARAHAFSVERPAAFDDRFADVWRATWRQYGITGERSAALLNWKYELEDPSRTGPRYSILAVVDAARNVAGYVVYKVKDGVRHVFDIACLASQPVIDALLSELVLDARREGASAITFLYLGPNSLLIRRLRVCGFISRAEKKRLFVYVGDGAWPRVDPLERRNWYFLTGDDDF